VRWIYSHDNDTIHYKANGNKVPKSDGAHPLMELPEGNALPEHIDMDAYLALAVKHLEELGVNYA
jgi:hypothetical protein